MRPNDQAERLFRRARAERWDLPLEVFTEALSRSRDKAFAGKTPAAREVDRYLETLHLEDLALACACAAGHEAAWEHFILQARPVLYRAADAIDPSGGARELADSLYAELYGLRERGGSRQSLFRYFHGRSSLTTWLRAVLAQRHVDRLRAGRRLEPLPEEETPITLASPSPSPDLDRPRFVDLIRRALAKALSRLNARDRLRLACYYAQEMTLAQIGRLLREHEATVSRHLAGTRRTIREDVERQLRDDAGLSEAQIDECFASVMSDAGTLDLNGMLATAGERKETGMDRSNE